MKNIWLLLALLNAPALGQTVYQSHEVEQSANPTGGTTMLNQFITANLQIPIEAAAKGLNGGVYVKGIVNLMGASPTWKWSSPSTVCATPKRCGC